MTRILRLLLIAAIALPYWQPVAAESVTVCSGGARSEFVPVYGYWIDTEGVESQMIYPTAQLGIPGGNQQQIESITFYSDAEVPESLGDATVIVRMGETYNTEISSRSDMVTNRNGLQVVYEGALPTGAAEMTINLETPYVYQGNNLIIDIYVAEGAENCDHCYWLGAVQSGKITSWNSKDGGEEFLPKMTVSYGAFQEQVLNFGKIAAGSNTTGTITIANSAGATIEENLDAPFSIVSRDGDTFTIKFAPADATSYTDYLVLKINGKNISARITGIGLGGENDGPVATRDEAFFKNITYTWREGGPNSNGTEHTSNLAEIATDPDQIIAMLKKVYTEQSIPGNLTRGYSTSGVRDSRNVLYTGVGQLARINNTNNAEYDDAYGWNISGNASDRVTSGNYRYWYMEEQQYEPNEEGVTLLLMEVADDFVPPAKGSTTTLKRSTYAELREYFRISVKSARVVTEAKRTGNKSDFSSGTLFKIDCDKMNNFFLLAKGQLLWFSPRSQSNNYSFYDNPCLIRSGNNNNYTYAYSDYGLRYYGHPSFLCHMFEQFSPVIGNSTTAKTDIYQELIGMNNFGVEHDCPNVPYLGHHFMMYNSDYDGDCADVRDMMFFVPDYRMMNHDMRGGTNVPNVNNRTMDYFYYHTEHQPIMGLYVITQDPIDGKQVDDKDMYQLTLTWDSNLDDYLPTDEQEYQLFQVITDEHGVEQYVPVYYMNSDGQYLIGPNGSVVTTPVPVKMTLAPNAEKKYTEVYIPMQESSQQVTFAVRGQDATHFLDLKTSNKRDFVIPGLDPNEKVEITDATHYSRFNPQTVMNCYSNKISIANNAMGLVNAEINPNNTETKLTVVRSHAETVNGATTTVKDPIAEITFNKDDSKYTVSMLEQSAKTAFPEGKSTQNTGNYAGYHANNGNVEGNGTWQQNYTVNSGGYVNFGSLNIYDNFVVDVANNNHPNSYTYQLTSNYQGMPSMYMELPSSFANGRWYAYTFKVNDDNTDDTSVTPVWVKATLLETKDNGDRKYVFYINNVMNKIILVRMNPDASNIPSWGAKTDQTQNLNIVDGGTYKITSWHNDQNNMSVDYTAPAADYSSMAHSNSFDVRVYKTDSKINNVYTQAEVDADATGYSFENGDLTFEEKLQYSSKKDILRYDVYRWLETEKRFIVDRVTGKDNEEQDISPNGQADNQDASYTIKMNAQAQGSVSVPTGSNDKWAQFVDHVPENAEEVNAYTYAPVVEVFSKGKTSDDQNKDRTDYNTYGGPLKNAAVGELDFHVVEPGSNNNPLMSEYYWTSGGKKFAYYNLQLSIDTKNIPAGYKIYKIRAWREMDANLLGEEYAALSGRLMQSYKFEEITFGTDQMDDFLNNGYKLGSGDASVTVTGANGKPQTIDFTLGTFGAQKLRTDEPASDHSVSDGFTVGFFVRVYFTRTANLQQTTNAAGIHTLAEGDLPADGKFYMVEANNNIRLNGGQVPTGIENLNARQVVDMKYYNPAGIESDTPFQGVNIVVTRYSDGSTTTTKILK